MLGGFFLGYSMILHSRHLSFHSIANKCKIYGLDAVGNIGQQQQLFHAVLDKVMVSKTEQLLKVKNPTFLILICYFQQLPNPLIVWYKMKEKNTLWKTPTTCLQVLHPQLFVA